MPGLALSLRPWMAAAAALALAGALRARADEPYPLTVKVGEAVDVCRTGTITCPAGAAICDDLAVAAPEIDKGGLVFKGVAPGTTLCSAGSGAGQGYRRVYRVTVTGRKGS